MYQLTGSLSQTTINVSPYTSSCSVASQIFSWRDYASRVNLRAVLATATTNKQCTTTINSSINSSNNTIISYYYKLLVTISEFVELTGIYINCLMIDVWLILGWEMGPCGPRDCKPIFCYFAYVPTILWVKYYYVHDLSLHNRVNISLYYYYLLQWW